MSPSCPPPRLPSPAPPSFSSSSSSSSSPLSPSPPSPSCSSSPPPLSPPSVQQTILSRTPAWRPGVRDIIGAVQHTILSRTCGVTTSSRDRACLKCGHGVILTIWKSGFLTPFYLDFHGAFWLFGSWDLWPPFIWTSTGPSFPLLFDDVLLLVFC